MRIKFQVGDQFAFGSITPLIPDVSCGRSRSSVQIKFEAASDIAGRIQSYLNTLGDMHQ